MGTWYNGTFISIRAFSKRRSQAALTFRFCAQ
jgi:hypothetical protein